LYLILRKEYEVNERALLDDFAQSFVCKKKYQSLIIRVSDSHYKDIDNVRAPVTHASQIPEMRPEMKDDHLSFTLIKPLGYPKMFTYTIHNPVDVEYVVVLSEQQRGDRIRELLKKLDEMKLEKEKDEAQRVIINNMPYRHPYPKQIPFVLSEQNTRAVIRGIIDEYVWRISRRYGQLGGARPVAFDAALLSYEIDA
jgi:hypothetical protein